MREPIDLGHGRRQAWQAIGAQGDGAALRSTLLACYSEPHRHHHDTQHLTECLRALQAQDEHLLIDVDLGLLGAPRQRFEAYEQQVRREYAHVPVPAFRAGRTQVLQGFLHRPRIYGGRTHFNCLLEARARDNLAWSIARLAGDGSAG